MTDRRDPQADLREEQELLDRAYRGLEAMRADATRMLQSVLDVGRGGTFQSRTERDIVVRTSLARLSQLDIGDQALCFGRIDQLPTEPGRPGESYHIGRLAVSGADLEPLVVDWRAPVAEPFYRATGLDPRGLARRRHLAVRGRRVVGVEDEHFAGPEAPPTEGSGAATATATAADGQGGAGEPVDAGVALGGAGSLLSVLGRERTGWMADIVATIQREQDEIIRAPLGGVLMVQGGPGTGKTAVALHRAAYLLYTHRFPLERQGVLVVGPNLLFLRYIERVLPSLGESGVTLSTVSGLVPEIRVRGTDPPALARLKGEARMAKVIARAVRTRQRALRRDVLVPFGAVTLRLSADASERIVTQARRRSGSHNARRRFVEQQVGQLLAEQYLRARRRFDGGRRLERRSSGEGVGPGGGPVARAGADVAGDVEVEGGGEADRLELVEMGRRLRRVPALAEALDRMWPRLAPHELLHDLLGARPLLAAAGRGVLTSEEQASLFRQRSASLDDVAWTAADAALVDEARTVLGPRSSRPRRARQSRERAERARVTTGSWPAGLAVGPLEAAAGSLSHPEDEGARSFGHIVVDEAQDLSPLQLRMLARRSISGSMTVVGDVAQATGPWAPSGWEEVARHLSPTRTPRLVELTVGYRTPAEVMRVAAGVLAVAAPGLTPPRPVRRSGHDPVFVAAAAGELGARVAEAAGAEVALGGAGRTAVIVPTSLHDEVTLALAARRLDAVDPRDPASPGLTAPLVVLPAADSHGLEFDSVVVVEPALIVAEQGDGPGAGGEQGVGGGKGGGSAALASPEPQPAATTRGLRTLYVALTRPTRRLVVVHSQPLPPGLRGS